MNLDSLNASALKKSTLDERMESAGSILSEAIYSKSETILAAYGVESSGIINTGANIPQAAKTPSLPSVKGEKEVRAQIREHNRGRTPDTKVRYGARTANIEDSAERCCYVSIDDVLVKSQKSSRKKGSTREQKFFMIMDVSQIESLDANELNQTLIRLGAQFDKFAKDLANGSIKELAPPFTDYHSYQGSIVSYYKSFFEKYLIYLDDIDENTWNFVNISMTAYIKKYSENHITVAFDLKSECKQLMNSILNSVSEYYNGAPNKAFESLRDCFMDNNGHLLNLIPQIQYKGNLYRVRNKANLKDNKELFHTPFELRTKCGSYRFSILGEAVK